MDHRELNMSPEEFRRLSKAKRASLDAGVEAVQDTAEELRDFLHATSKHFIEPGEQLTIEFGSECGFAGRIIIQVDAASTCGIADEVDEEINGFLRGEKPRTSWEEDFHAR